MERPRWVNVPPWLVEGEVNEGEVDGGGGDDDTEVEEEGCWGDEEGLEAEADGWRGEGERAPTCIEEELPPKVTEEASSRRVTEGWLVASTSSSESLTERLSHLE